MTHSLKNDKSKFFLKNKLFEGVTSIKYVNRPLMTWATKFSKFSSEAIKSNNKWVSEEDILGIFYKEYIASFSKDFDINACRLPLTEILGSSEIDDLCLRVVSALAEIPNEYEIIFPAPRLSPIELGFKPNVSIKPEVKSNFSDGLIYCSTINVRSNGYAATSRNQSAIREATLYLKVFFSLGLLYDFFRRRQTYHLNDLTDHIANTKIEKMQYARIRKISSPDLEPLHAPLGSGFSKLLNEVYFRNDIDSASFKLSYDKFFKLFELIYEKDADDNVKSIRNALFWLFDAQTDDDETSRFIKTCIGLEAAISEQMEGVGITEQLADRAAFLLRKTPKGREETRMTMREIYRLRSKIVHGNISGLSHSDLRTSENASLILNSIITLELDAIYAWWGDYQKKIAGI